MWRTFPSLRRRALGSLVTRWVALGLFLTAPAFYLVRSGIQDPSVNVRWSQGIDAAQRAALEARFGLVGGELQEASTWSYRLLDTSRPNVSALIAHPSVADTHKIDRKTLEVEGAVSYLDTLPGATAIGFGSSALVWLGIALWGSSCRVVGRVRDVMSPAVDRLATFPHAKMRPWEAVIGLGLGLYFLAPLLMYGPWDHEEVGLGLFSSQVFYRNLFNGHWNFWLNNLGFGTPMPIGQRLDFHPVFALGSLVSLRVAVSMVWVAHVTLMIVYFRRMAALLAIGPAVRMVLTACCLFSAPSVNYFYATDWVSTEVAWSVYPALAYYLHRTITEDPGPSKGIAAVRLALLGGFWVLNSHPGYLPPLALILALYALLLARPRLRVYGALLGAIGLCAAASAERLYFSVSEAGFFPSSLPRFVQGGYTISDYLWAAAVPFTQLSDGLRQPFIGLVIGLAAAVSLFVPFKVAGARAAGLAFAIALMLSLLPMSVSDSLKSFSGVWYFRDPMVFFGLLAAGVLLQLGVDARNTRWRAITIALLAAQLLQQAAAVHPAYQQVAGRGGPLLFYRYQEAPVRTARTLVDRAGTYGPRLYASEEVRARLRGGMSHLGIHSITDLVLFGLNPINGWFKNISMDRLHPSAQLMHGMILGQRDVIAHQPLLDALGVNLVWATAADGPFSPEMVVTDRWPTGGGRNYMPDQQDLVLLGNPNAWPRAVLLSEAVGHMHLPVRAACPHRAALCRDFSSFVQQRLPDKVELEEGDGWYSARFTASSQARLLFISATYRPEWQASSAAGPLPVEPAAGAFLGVNVPAGVQAIELRFNPRLRLMLAWVSYGTMLTLVAIVCANAWRRRHHAFTR